jgi:hypothetical protein
MFADIKIDSHSFHVSVIDTYARGQFNNETVRRFLPNPHSYIHHLHMSETTDLAAESGQNPDTEIPQKIPIDLQLPNMNTPWWTNFHVGLQELAADMAGYLYQG